MKTSGYQNKKNSIVAFSQQSSGVINVVEMKKAKLQYAHTSEADGQEELIRRFAAARAISRREDSVMGIDSKGIAFYRLEIPPVNDAQIPSLVAMQIEMMLPLPPDQMQVAFLADDIKNSARLVTVAVARKQSLKKHADFARDCQTSNVMLNCQGLVKAFNNLYDCPRDTFVIANIRTADTQLLLTEKGRLLHAITLDIGSEDLSESDDFTSSQNELFVHDLASAIDHFAEKTDYKPQIVVLSSDALLADAMVTLCNDADLTASQAVYNGGHIKAGNVFADDEQLQYLEAIGLAMFAIEGDTSKIDLFQGLSEPKTKKKEKNPLTSLIVSLAIFTALLMAALYISTQLNIRYLASYENKDVDQLIKMQKVRKYVAAQRPDLLDLLTEISKDAPKGMMIDSFSFKKGQPVTISGNAAKGEEVLKFQEFLGGKKDISNVNIVISPADKKTKKTPYRITFHYKHWTKKSSKK
ncbi:MAG: PilN domain-containing protein [Planctomycetes bacterium]|nr:PilN domain-containing protein [Planctomycetota bacterium]